MNDDYFHSDDYFHRDDDYFPLEDDYLRYWSIQASQRR
jgi:hypothetical protein